MQPAYCPNCKSIRFTKFGTRNGKQRYRCKVCNYRFTGNTILRKRDQYYKTKALQLWVEGLTFFTIGHLIGFSDDTISKWLKPYIENLQPLQLDRRKFSGRIKQYGKIIYVGGLTEHASGILVDGFASSVFGVSRKRHSEFLK